MRANTIRIYVEGPLEAGLDIACTRAQANYHLNIMHLGDGAEILIFDGSNGEWRASLTRNKRNDCALHILEQVRPQKDGPDVHYLFAPLKGERLDFMVQKATELGVAALCPVLTRRTDVQRVKLERIRSHVIEAAEQCGVLRIPHVCEPVSLDTLLEGWDPARRIVYCDEEAPVTSPLEALRTLEPGPLAVLTGPEGGFDAEERTRLRGLSCVTPISLGPRVMRADTSSVAALSLVNAVLGDWR
jgi:16S rRNA (uracil1498-N3)-methyltransferase